jgi:hypothetical protein
MWEESAMASNDLGTHQEGSCLWLCDTLKVACVSAAQPVLLGEVAFRYGVQITQVRHGTLNLNLGSVVAGTVTKLTDAFCLCTVSFLIQWP